MLIKKKTSLPYSPDSRLRQKLAVWKLRGIPGINERRVLNAFSILRRNGAPRLMSSYLRTLFNGWATDRRFRSLLVKSGQQIRVCVLGCGKGEDDLQHYVRCPVFRDFVHRTHPAGLGLTLHGVEAVLLVADNMSTDEKIQMYVGLYALFRSVHFLRKANDPRQYDALTLLRL
eukprot:3501560-Karenia_brevis.AAC.1